VEESVKEKCTPMLRPVKMKGTKGSFGALDSGATNPVRTKRKEDKATEKVTVTLAGNKEIEMEKTPCGTLLVKEEVQVIVPMMKVLEDLSCTLSSGDGGRVILVHPEKGNIPVHTETGSMLIEEKICLELIEELEEKEEYRQGMGKVIEEVMKRALKTLKDKDHQLQEKEEMMKVDEYEMEWWGVQKEESLSSSEEEETEIKLCDTEEEILGFGKLSPKKRKKGLSSSSRNKALKESLILFGCAEEEKEEGATVSQCPH